MRVLMVNSFYPPNGTGGAERSVQILSEGLLAKGVDVRVLALGDGTHRELNGVRVTDLCLANAYIPNAKKASTLMRTYWHARDAWNRQMAGAVASEVERLRPDVVHTNNLAGFSGAVFPALHRLGVPIVHTLRDYYLLCARSTMWSKAASCATACGSCRTFTAPRRTASRHVDAVAGNSQAVLDAHSEAGLFQSNINRSVIYNGYSVGPEATFGTARVVADRNFRLAFVGKIHPSKGVGVLIEGVSGLPQRGWELKVAGQGEPSYVEELARQSRGLPIQFLGHVPPGPVYDWADVVVVPSIWRDPAPRVVFEALSHGAFVVASAAGGNIELAAEVPEGVALVEAGSVAVLRDCLTELLGGKRVLPDRAVVACRARAKFDPGRVVQDYMTLYRQVLQARA